MLVKELIEYLSVPGGISAYITDVDESEDKYLIDYLHDYDPEKDVKDLPIYVELL